MAEEVKTELAKETASQPATYENDESAAVAIEALIDKKIADEEKAAQPQPEAKAEEKVEEEPQPETEDDSKITFDPEAKVIEVEEVIEGGSKETRKYSLNELKAQRMMQADYQRKTAELARQREKVSDDARQAVENERKRFMESATSIQRALFSVAAQEFQQEGVDITNQFGLQAYMGKLAKDDPAKYVQMTNRLNELNSTVNLVGKTLDTERSKARDDRNKEVTKQAREAWETLGRDIKGWNDEAYNKLLKVGYEYGFKPEEISNPVRADGTIPDGYIPAVDPRFIKLLNDASAYRQQQSAKPMVEKKVSAAPKVMKPGAPAKDDNKQRQDEQMGRLKKSGRVEDAAKIFEGMMK